MGASSKYTVITVADSILRRMGGVGPAREIEANDWNYSRWSEQQNGQLIEQRAHLQPMKPTLVFKTLL